jgi:hypothetical protein
VLRSAVCDSVSVIVLALEKLWILFKQKLERLGVSVYRCPVRRAACD